MSSFNQAEAAISLRQAWNRCFATFARRNLRLGENRDSALAGWLFLAILCSFLAYIARMHEVTHDAFHEMALVREALATGSFPVEDVFAYTPTVSPAVHHEWGTGAILYFATFGTGLGVYGLAVLRLLLVFALWLLLYRVARMRGAHPYVFAMFSFIVFPVLWVGFATLRAQAFTLVFIALQLWMQELDWRGRRSWIVLWLLMLVAWLNIHAGFVVGAGMIALHTVERFLGVWLRTGQLRGAVCAVWHLIAAAPVAVFALQLNPYGWEYIPYLVRAIGMPRPSILEWQPLWYSYTPGITLFLFAASIGLFAYAQRHSRFGRWRGTILVATSAYMAFRHIRHGSIYAIIWIAYVPAWLSRTPLGKAWVAVLDRHRNTTKWVSQGLIVFCLGFSGWHHIWQPTMPPQRLYSSACYPTGALEYLKQHEFCGNLLTPFYVGAYISWEMYPNVKVSLDGRYEVAFQANVLPEHDQFFEGTDNWWQVLERYPTDAALIHIQAPVLKQLEQLAADPAEAPEFLRSWRIVYRDRSFVIIAPERVGLPTLDNSETELIDGACSAFAARRAHWSYLDESQLRLTQ
jgi:hypothetical protein